MDRKQFLGSAVGLLGATAASANSQIGSLISLAEEVRYCRIPSFLKDGDTIAITSPAGYISLDDIQPAVQKLESWGFRIKIGKTIGKKDFTFGGTDEERRADFQDLLDDDSVKAVLCARGGYGIVRIIDSLDFNKFGSKPKWIIGFSDVTVLHNHINSCLGIATIHSKMCNSFPKEWNTADVSQKLSLESINDCLRGNACSYFTSPNKNNRYGTASAELVGGNLRIIETLAGTKSDLKTKNKILFLEDTEEYLYNIDRMFWNLKRTGKLDHLKGLIIGGFKIKPDDPGEEFGLSPEQIVLEKVKEFNYPVCFDFPVGHQLHNMALKCGMRHLLNVWPDTVNLTDG